jgi:hypothetical protein
MTDPAGYQYGGGLLARTSDHPADFGQQTVTSSDLGRRIVREVAPDFGLQEFTRGAGPRSPDPLRPPDTDDEPWAIPDETRREDRAWLAVLLLLVALMAVVAWRLRP